MSHRAVSRSAAYRPVIPRILPTPSKPVGRQRELDLMCQAKILKASDAGSFYRRNTSWLAVAIVGVLLGTSLLALEGPSGGSATWEDRKKR